MENFAPEILKPGRYINHEWNAVHKEWKDSMLKVALCFPDIYEIGMSHLGMKIIYGVLNQEDDIVCERVFAPWGDMEKMIRSGKDALLSLEGRRRLKEFDIVGFSLQYEMNFVDVLNMLDLGQIPVRACERDDAAPLIIAGGSCCFNPEVMADFIDAFVVGEAEEVVLEIVGVIRGSRFEGRGSYRCSKFDTRSSRDEILKELSKIKGVYVPSYVIARPKAEAISEIASLPAVARNDTIINKRIIKDLDASYFPTAPIVPYIQIVHDRIALEIMRGCPHKCRFCQACKIFHPFRIRSVERILEIAERSVKNTGYEEISLLSLSTSDYPYLEELVRKLEERLKRLGVKISLPSIRAQSFKSSECTNIVKRAGLTFAPEAGSDSLRKKSNKNMSNEEIIRKSRIALNTGWRKVKLYFMIGLPGETYRDLDAIIELASEIKNIGPVRNRFSNRVNLSISPFIPKPHSEFEREGMDSVDMLKDKKNYLSSRFTPLDSKHLTGFKVKGSRQHMKVDFHNLEMSRIEAILSRGDKRIGQVIQGVWHKGARLQAWDEYFKYRLWIECFEEIGIDPENYLKKKDNKDILPWSFIR